MFSYNPGVVDRSGEILANGVTNAAAVNAQMMQQLGSDIAKPIRTAGKAIAGFAMGGPAGAAMAVGQGGGEEGGSVLSSIANMYAENKAMKTKADSYDKVADILGTAMFSGNPNAMSMFSQIKSAEDPREKIMGYETLFSLLGPMSNMMMAQGRLGVQQQQPFVNAGLKNAADIAAGNQTFTGGGAPAPADVASTEPLLPPYSPEAGAAPAPTPTSTVPGGQASLDALNESRRRRGLKPIR